MPGRNATNETKPTTSNDPTRQETYEAERGASPPACMRACMHSEVTEEIASAVETSNQRWYGPTAAEWQKLHGQSGEARTASATALRMAWCRDDGRLRRRLLPTTFRVRSNDGHTPARKDRGRNLRDGPSIGTIGSQNAGGYWQQAAKY